MALVLTGVFAFAFCALIAFGVDLGNWYLQAEKVQRAADNAALAAAVALPSPDANDKAYETAAKNGYANGNGVIVDAASAGQRSVVKVTNQEVKTFFISYLIPKLSITRTATAEKSSSLPLGSQYNVLGSGTLSLPMKGGGQFRSDTWLAINAPCTAREDGDYFASYYLGNKGATKTSCPGSVKNPAYDINGYSYYIDIPKEQNSSVNVRLFDPAHVDYPGQISPDPPVGASGDLQGCVDVMFGLWRTNSSGPETLIKQETYRCYTNKVPENAWVDFATIPADASGVDREYRVQVSTWNFAIGTSGPDNYWGANVFSIMASPGGDNSVCDTRVDAACPRVYGKTAISLLNSFSGMTGNTARFSLAGVPVEYAGTEFEISIFDPGEGVQSIEVVKPNGSLATFSWKAYPEDVAYSGTNVTSIDTSGFGPQPYAGDGVAAGSNYKFNDRRLVLKIPVPAEGSQWLGANNNNWWEIQYTMANSAKPNPDRTTWGADMGGSGPAHLIRNGVG